MANSDQAGFDSGFGFISWTHVQGGADRITSVAIPLAFAGVGLFLLGGGLANMYRGVGKRDQ